MELPVLKYCSPFWMSAAASRLSLIDCILSKSVKLSDGMVLCDSEHRCRVAALCVFSFFYCNPNHALEVAVPQVYVPARLTRLAVSVHSRYLIVPGCRRVQFGRSFVHACV